MPDIMASTDAFTMSSLAALALDVIPLLSSSLTITSARAFEPPVMASSLNSFSLISSMPLTDFLTALSAASTGPTPVSSASISTPSNLILTFAEGVILFPVVTWYSSRSTIFSSLETSPRTASAIAFRSASVTSLPLSPSVFCLVVISCSCVLLTVNPISFSIAPMPCDPACLPPTSLLLCPTISGVINPGSNVLLSLTIPCVCIPDSCEKAFSPTTGKLGGILIPVVLSTSLDVSTRYSVFMFVLTPYNEMRAITVSSRFALPALSPSPFTETCTCLPPASIDARLLGTASPKSLWQCTSMGISTCLKTSPTSSRIPVGIITPTVSGMLIMSAPASSTHLFISIR